MTIYRIYLFCKLIGNKNFTLKIRLSAYYVLKVLDFIYYIQSICKKKEKGDLETDLEIEFNYNCQDSIGQESEPLMKNYLKNIQEKEMMLVNSILF